MGRYVTDSHIFGMLYWRLEGAPPPPLLLGLPTIVTIAAPLT